MRMLTFAGRNTKEIIRDPLNLCFGLGFPLVLILMLSAIQANIPVSLFEIEHLTPGITVFGPTDLFDTGPVSDSWLMVHDREKCAPCLKRVCPKGNAVCTRKIVPSQIIRAIHKEAKRLQIPLVKNRKVCLKD